MKSSSRNPRRDFLKTSLFVGGSFLLFPGSIYACQNREQIDYPSYVKLEREGILAKRVEEAYAIYEECRLCPRECGVNRIKGEKGFCRAPAGLKIYSANPHYGEERSLVGKGGSGTIFFSHCNLRCVFCQNWSISHEGHGKKIKETDLAGTMLYLQKIGCHNINVVTPTHIMPSILRALRIACQKGLRIPLVYNTSGYERVEMIKVLDGIADIYLPDMKFMNSRMAEKYSGGAADYPDATKKAVIEMNRQVGEHVTDKRGIAVRGLMIRHLVMPNRVSGALEFAKWVSENLSQTTYVNIMKQYRVEYKAFDYPAIWRRITVREYLEAMEWAESYGLTNLDPDSVKAMEIYRSREQRAGS